jgi:hypothetical protein
MATPYKQLDLERGEIRLLVLQPGQFSDPIRASLRYDFLAIPDGEVREQKADMESLRTTLPPGWEVHQTFEGRVIFWNEKEQKSSWSHPDPAMAYTAPPARQPWRLYAGQPEFEALSYCWGPALLGEHVTMEASDGHHNGKTEVNVPVTDNLASALRYLRRPSSTRTLWVDALCINQADGHERSRHVARMGSVYQLATRVVAWLGPESDDSTLALDTLEHLGKQIEMKSSGQIPSPIADHPEWYANYPCNRKTITALKSLLHRHWTQRLWVWQEIVLANNDALMQCGHKTILWYYMRRGIVLLRETNLPDVEMRSGLISTTMCWLPYIFETDALDWRDVSKLLQSTSQAGCTDPRDRIYGVLGMCPREVAARIKPDYTLSHAQIYRDFFKQIVEQYGKLILLQHCDLLQRRMEGPTWVPDWSHMVKRPWQLVYAAGASKAHVKFTDDDGVMSVLGVRAAKVIAVSEREWVDPPGSVSEVFEILQEWYSLCRQHARDNTVLEDFITPIRYGWTYERRHIADSAAQHAEDWLNLMESKVTPPGGDLNRSFFLQSVIRDERNCAFFCTDDGKAGLGPLGTETGKVSHVLRLL